MNEAIKTYIEEIAQEWQSEICQQLDDIITTQIPDVEARIQYRKPHYLKNGKYVVPSPKLPRMCLELI